MGSNLALHSYHATAMFSIHDEFIRCKYFFFKKFFKFQLLFSILFPILLLPRRAPAARPQAAAIGLEAPDSLSAETKPSPGRVHPLPSPVMFLSNSSFSPEAQRRCNIPECLKIDSCRMFLQAVYDSLFLIIMIIMLPPTRRPPLHRYAPRCRCPGSAY